jgi:hypothetical protein
MRRVPAILLVIIFAVPLLGAALLTISISTWVLDRSFYISIMDNDSLYQIPDATSSATWWADSIPGFEGLDNKAVRQASREVLTPDYLRSQAVSVINQVFDLLQGRGNPTVTIDLTPVKAALRGDQGRRFAQELAKDLPVGGTVAGFAAKAKTLPRSRPASISVDQAAAIIRAGLPAFTSSIPDTVRVGDEYTFATWPFEHGTGINVLGLLILGDVILLLFGCGFWIAAAFVGGETKYERLQWLGWVLLVPAAGVFLVGLLTMTGVFSGWATWGIGQARLETAGFAPTFVTALMDSVRQAITRVGVGFIATGAVAAGAALGLLAWSWSIPSSERKPGSAPAVPSAPTRDGGV